MTSKKPKKTKRKPPPPDPNVAAFTAIQRLIERTEQADDKQAGKKPRKSTTIQ
jgi:hypothetical protein